MANGKPGDHPINDILDYSRPVFSPAIDGMIREIAALVPRYKLVKLFDWFAPPPLAKFEEQVREVLAGLRADARARGWESQGPE